MKYNKIRKMDISNGPGVRVSIFMQGCAFNCKNCFNPETHDFNGGKEFTEETINRVLELCSNEYIVGLSILGGEPMHPKNIEGTTKLAKAFKEKFPNKSLWVWSGFLFEDLKDKEVLKYVDVLVDGTYKDELHNFLLKWCGSSNQRVIDVKKSLKNNKIVLFEENKEAKEKEKQHAKI
jgi:anaerobic ribonucleoside-triphosphate reductase activating protein